MFTAKRNVASDASSDGWRSQNLVSRGGSAWKSALALAASFALVKLLMQFALTLWTTHQGYGYFRDEFYFLACGRHLAWGYVDQGPIVALQARLGEMLFGDSVFGIRVLAAVAGALAVGLGGLLTWALGGRRAAQALAMLGLLMVPVYIGVDGFLSITCLEPVFWTVCVLLLVLLERGGRARELWIAFGLWAGVGLLNKPSMLFFLGALVFGLLVTPQRRLLRTPWVLVAALLIVAICTPHLLWQVHNGWPTWEFLHNGRVQNKAKLLSPLSFLGAQVGEMQPLNALLWGTGLVACLRGKSLQGYRWIAWTFLAFFLLMLALHAKDYYVAPVYPMLFTAGAVAWEARFAAAGSGRRWNFALPIFEAALVLTTLIILPTASPVLRPQTYDHYMHTLHLQPDESENLKASILPQFYADRFGWDQLTDIVVTAYRSLPAEDRRHVCIFTSNYGEAGALEFFGQKLEPGMPRVISGHNNYWLWGQRGCSGDPVIAVVGDSREDLATKYESVTVIGHMSDPLAMSYEHKNVYLLRHRKPAAPVNWADEKSYI